MADLLEHAVHHVGGLVREAGGTHLQESKEPMDLTGHAEGTTGTHRTMN